MVDKAKGDDGNTGTETEPVRTISRALLLSEAGDEVVVREGTYWRIEVGGRARGKEGKPLVIRSEGKVVVQGGIEIKGEAGYVRVEGFEVVGDGVRVDGKANEVRNCHIHDLPGKTGIEVRGEDHRVVGNRIERVSFGMVVRGKGHLVEGNEICQLVWGPGVNDCDYIRFFGEGHIFRRNYLAGAKGEARGGGFRTYAAGKGEYAADILIEGNLIGRGCATGVHIQGKANWEGRETSAEKIVVRNNVIAGCPVGLSVTQVSECVIERNTFLNLGGGTGQPVSVKNCAGKVTDNIFYNAIAGGTLTKTSVFGGLMEVVGNILFNEGGRQFLAEGWLENTVNRDPLLADPTNPLGADGKPFTPDDGYLLTADSPFKGKGAR